MIIVLIVSKTKLSLGLIALKVPCKDWTASGSEVSAIFAISALIPSALASVMSSAANLSSTSLLSISIKPSEFSIKVKSTSDADKIVVFK